MQWDTEMLYWIFSYLVSYSTSRQKFGDQCISCNFADDKEPIKTGTLISITGKKVRRSELKVLNYVEHDLKNWALLSWSTKHKAGESKTPENMWPMSGDSSSTPAFGKTLFLLC